MIRAALLSTLLLSTVSQATARQAERPGSTQAAATGGLVPPMVVTSDTGAYCDALSRQIDQHGGRLPEQVAVLREQGRHLCANGQVRGGINRLRRALMELREPGEPDDDALDGPDGEAER